MKKKLFIPLAMFLATLLIISSCQKSITESNDEAAGKVNDKQKNECRLTEADFPGAYYKYHYNSQGLCDEWDISDYGLFKQEYDATGRLTKSRMYNGDELVYTIDFFYTGKKVTKEIWYYGNSSDVYDEVLYTYNSRGQNTRMESFLSDYYTVNTFDAAGNVTAWDFYSGSILTYSSRAAYGHPYKNPSRATPGIDYGFPFLNAAVFTNPFCISSERLVAYDVDGNPTVWYDYDPSQTTYQPASQNYPASGSFYDLVTNGWTSQTFQYENCAHGNGNATRSATGSASANKAKGNTMQFLMKGNLKSLRNGIK